MQKTTEDKKVIAAVWAALGETGEVPERLTVTVAKVDQARPCECGCGGLTGGGLWRPGHDAKHKSVLYAVVRDPEAPEAAKADALEELGERGWPLPAAKKAKAEPVAS